MVYEFIGFVIEARSLGRRNVEDGSGWIFKGRMGQHITNHIAVALKALLIILLIEKSCAPSRLDNTGSVNSHRLYSP